VLALLLSACATSHSGRPQEIAFREPSVIEGRSADADLATKNDEELFAIGTAAAQAGDLGRAAAAFSHLVDTFPDSRRARAALHEVGVAWHRLERWDLALARFRQLAEGYTGPDADEASFLSAEALYRLGRHREARDALDRLAARPDLEPSQVSRALTQRGVVELEDGEPDVAERSLKLALSGWQAAESKERIGPYYPAKARFYMGEVYRSYFQAVKLDPAGHEALLGQQLEREAQLLLSAQDHYLSAIRTGDAGWAVAAGARVGELYEGFHAQLVSSPLPAGLDEAEARTYREELLGRVRVLVTKAVAAYEETLSVARHTGVDSAFVPRAQEALERMRRILAEDALPAGPVLRGRPPALVK
jgi:tetratricopeptide (TPR) repeat protein